MMNSKIDECKILDLERFDFSEGNVAVIDNSLTNIPFDVKRIYYLYDIKSGKSRGAHAHKECHQLLIAASGSFEVEVFDGLNYNKIFLNHPSKGLYIPPGIWAEEKYFSYGAICLVLASDLYTEDDYIREIDLYKKEKKYDR